MEMRTGDVRSIGRVAREGNRNDLWRESLLLAPIGLFLVDAQSNGARVDNR
jgi:hypothetical protein